MLKNKLILSIAAVLGAASMSGFVAAVEIDPTDPDCNVQNEPIGGGSKFIEITAPVSGTIGDLDVIIGISTPFVGDLVITLKREGGTPITLMDKVPNGAGTCNVDVDTGFTLDDEAASSVQVQCADLNSGATWSPKDALSAFDGQDVSGKWIMTVSDECDAGSACDFSSAFNGWCLKSDVGGGVFSPADFNFDGKVDAIDLAFFEFYFNTQNLLGDLNSDGIVDAIDLAWFEFYFNQANNP